MGTVWTSIIPEEFTAEHVSPQISNRASEALSLLEVKENSGKKKQYLEDILEYRKLLINLF